jgi:lysophospholipase L1-like esterase
MNLIGKKIKNIFFLLRYFLVKTVFFVTTRKFKNLMLSLGLSVGSIVFFFLVAEGVTILLVDESKYIIEVTDSSKETKNRNEQNGLVYKNGIPSKEYYLRPDPHIKRDTDKFRIALVGDSYTEGAGVTSTKYAYDRQLQKMLDQDKDFPKSQVIKFAGDPLNSYQELILIRELVIDYNPDVLMLQFFSNDGQATRSHIASSPDNKDKYIFTDTNYIIENEKLMPSLGFLSKDMNELIIPHSSFLRYIAYKINMAQQIRTENIPQALDSIKEMIKITRQNNIPFFIMNFPSTENEDVFCKEKLSHNIKNKVKNISNELDTPFYDLCNGNNLNPAEHDSKIESGGHYNKKGYNIAAREIKRILKNNYLNNK